jgi:hypothetical protein
MLRTQVNKVGAKRANIFIYLYLSDSFKLFVTNHLFEHPDDAQNLNIPNIFHLFIAKKNR